MFFRARTFSVSRASFSRRLFPAVVPRPGRVPSGFARALPAISLSPFVGGEDAEPPAIAFFSCPPYYSGINLVLPPKARPRPPRLVQFPPATAVCVRAGASGHGWR